MRARKLWVALLLLAVPAAAQNRAAIASNDHYTNVVSSAPSEAGQTVRLYLRERVKAFPALTGSRLYR